MFLGIDLGTTYSVGAFINKDGEAEVITNAEGSRITPSVVYIESEDSVIVGQTAKSMAASFPNDVIALAKNSMGKVRKDGTPEDFLTTKGVFAPEYISAQVLMKVVADAQTYLNCDEIKDVVVTIPYTFDDGARKATEDAIRIAGLNRLAMINEPTAAAFYYATKLGINDSNVLVYDLGGGTFDVTIIHIDGDGNCNVVGGGGRSRIGGSTLDANLAKDICQEINSQCGIDVTTPEYNDVYQDILTRVEQAKITLSSANQTVIPIRIGSNALNITLTRDELNEKVKSVLYDVTEIQIDKTLRESKLTVADINKVIMVGGSSRIPFIEESLEKYFGQKPSREVNPDEVVALGAALYGRQLTDESAVKKTIVDASSHSVGIAALDPKTGEEYNDILIPKNTQLPASVEKVYAFADDDIEDIWLNVLEGERKELKFTNAICATNVKLPSKLAKGERVHVRLEIDKYQILHIFVRIPSAGNVETEISFDRKSNMSEAQISKWKKSAVKVKEKAAEKSSDKKGIFKSIFGKSDDASSEESKEAVKKKEIKKDKSQEIPKPIQTVMKDIIGMNEVKIALRNASNSFAQQKKRNLAGKSDVNDYCFAVLGKSGMGISTAAEKIAEALSAIGIANPSATPVVAYYNDIVKADEQETTNAIQALFQSAMDGILIIDDFHDFYSENESAAGMVACKYLYKAYKQCGGKICLIVAGEDEKIDSLFKIRDEFSMLFLSYKIYLQGYTPDEYVQMLHMYATNRAYVVDTDADPYLESYFKNHYKDEDYKHYYSVKELFEKARTDVANKASAKRHATDYDYSIIYLENFSINEKVKTLDELKEELNGYTGLTRAKEEINKIIKIQEKTIQKAKEEGIEVKGKGSMHMIFAGSPGTGKTTVARLVGEIYRELGILKTGQFIEVSGRSLISDVVGGSKVLVEKAVDRAIGGILFIDEAYAMYQNDNDQYGKEAVDTLVPLIENHRDELMVIMAGYTDDMAKFLSTANVGLASRFNTTIEFEDYNIDELVEIFHYNLAKDDYQMEGEAEKPVRELLIEKMKNPKFGNARGVRNIYEAVCARKEARLADTTEWGESEYHTIRAEDIRGAGEEAGKSIEELLDELNSKTGLRGVKEQVNAMVRNVMINKEREEKGGKASGVGTMHMIFAGNAGTGKTTVARLIGEIYKKLGLLGEGRTLEVSKPDLVGKVVGETEEKTKLLIERAIGNVLFIDEAYTLKDDPYGQNAIDTLLKGVEDNRDSMVVIIAGYEPDMLEFLNANQGLSSRFKTWVRFEDYTIDEMYQIFCDMVAQEGPDWHIAPDTENSIKSLLKASAGADKDFGNARGVRNVLDLVKSCLNTRMAEESERGIEHTLEEMNTICVADIERAAAGSLENIEEEKSFEELKAELFGMTGLASVKNQVNSIVNTIYINKRRAEAGMPVADIGTMHMIFAGNAGTGKTTVVRLIGKLYKHLGVLANGDTIEVGKQDLVAGFQGQTAIKTQAVIDKSLGNVLFVDEAYSLVNGDNDTFGIEAMETLLKGIEDHRKDMVVILAGYGPDMQHFLQTNQGLSSRFKNWIEFEDYSTDELMEILVKSLKKQGLKLAPDAFEKAKEVIGIRSKIDGFGNARGVRNFGEDLNKNMSNRLTAEAAGGHTPDNEALSLITVDDVF